jgi:hypothetical protein
MQLRVCHLRPSFAGDLDSIDAGFHGHDLDNEQQLFFARHFDECEARDLHRVTTRDVASTLDQVA